MKSRIVLFIILLIGLSEMNVFALPGDPRLPPGSLPKQESPRINQPSTQGKQKTITASAKWSAWVTGAKKSVRTVLPQWVQMASLTGGVVNGARVTEGALTSPNILPLLNVGMKTAGAPDKIANGFMGPVSEAWTFWAANIRVPGLPWYPSFEMFPGPVAPPTPSPATPLKALIHVTAPLTPSVLALTIRTRLGNEASSPEAVAAINDFCNWFYSGFNSWLSAATIREVMGTGRIPHFAAPVVNSGPVIGGTANGGKISPLPAWP